MTNVPQGTPSGTSVPPDLLSASGTPNVAEGGHEKDPVGLVLTFKGHGAAYPTNGKEIRLVGLRLRVMVCPSRYGQRTHSG